MPPSGRMKYFTRTFGAGVSVTLRCLAGNIEMKLGQGRVEVGAVNTLQNMRN